MNAKKLVYKICVITSTCEAVITLTMNTRTDQKLKVQFTFSVDVCFRSYFTFPKRDSKPNIFEGLKVYPRMRQAIANVCGEFECLPMLGLLLCGFITYYVSGYDAVIRNGNK